MVILLKTENANMKKNVPKIRFKGCQGEWVRKCFDEIYQLVSDRKHNIPKSEYKDLGKYPIIDQGKQYIIGYTDMDQPLVPQEGYVIFGDHTREVKFAEEPFYTGADGTKVLKKKGEDDSWFLYYCCTSISIPNTGYNRHFKYLKEAAFYIPPTLPEQHQIASYFRSLDGILSACEARLSSLRRLKEGALQAFFPQQGETQPKIRFKGCKGEWERKKLGDIARKVSEKNTQCEYKETFTNSAEMGIISQLDYFDHDITNKANISGYYVVQSDDFVYNPRISVTAPVGPISRNKLGRCGIMSPLYTVFHFEKVDNGFMEYYFKTIVWHSFMYQEGNTGARNDRFSIKDSVFFTMPILLPPTLPEQRQIANFFRALDHRIELERQRLEKLKQLKAACLEKMFV